MATQSTPNFYEILGISRNSTLEQIKEAYRRLVREHHPDTFAEARKAAKQAGNERLLRILEEKIQEAEEILKGINEAYETLSDPFKRRGYDEGLDQQAQQDAHGTSSTHSIPPDIRLSKTTLDFGQLGTHEHRADSFFIYNDGGPVTDVAIGWVEDPSWAVAGVVKNPITVFPIKVTVMVESVHAGLGRNAAGIAIVINGVPWKIVPVLATVVESASQAKPTYTWTPDPPKPASAPVVTLSPTTNGSSSGLRWMVIFGGIIGLVLLVAVMVGNPGRTNPPQIASQEQQTANNDMLADPQVYAQALASLPGQIKIQGVQDLAGKDGNGDKAVGKRFQVRNDSNWPIVVLTVYWGWDLYERQYGSDQKQVVTNLVYGARYDSSARCAPPFGEWSMGSLTGPVLQNPANGSSVSGQVAHSTETYSCPYGSPEYRNSAVCIIALPYTQQALSDYYSGQETQFSQPICSR